MEAKEAKGAREAMETAAMAEALAKALAKTLVDALVNALASREAGLTEIQGAQARARRQGRRTRESYTN